MTHGMADEMIDNREKGRVMRTKTKVVCWGAVGAVALVSGAMMVMGV